MAGDRKRNGIVSNGTTLVLNPSGSASRQSNLTSPRH